MASSEGNEPRSFAQATKDHLLVDMLRSARGGSSTEWKVLVMDDVTVKVMSTRCHISDITDEGISLVESLKKRRQPLTTLDAVYFITPSRESVTKFMQDMTGSGPLYRKAYVFFSSTLPRDLLGRIKEDRTLLSRIAALKEVNMEYLAVDTQGFVVDLPEALPHLFGEHSAGSREFDLCIGNIVTRLTTVFAALKELPAIRFRSTSSSSAGAQGGPGDVVCSKIATQLSDRVSQLQRLQGFPQRETCDLVIVDRAFDPVAPVIHEFTYEAMLHDLLEVDGTKFKYEVTTSGGRTETKEVLLEEHDSLWMELRDSHIAEVNIKLDEKMSKFRSMNKVAMIKLGRDSQQDLSTKDIKTMVQALPQYRDQIDKLGLHVHIATKLMDRFKEKRLKEIANLEQDLVFGDATSKEMQALFMAIPNMHPEDKLRLLMIYAASHPEKLDPKKERQWMKILEISGEDWNAVNNLEHLGVSVFKKSSSAFLKFGMKKSRRPMRKDRQEDEGQWDLSKFSPLLQDVVEDLAKGELSKEEYPYVKEPSVVDTSSSSGRAGGTSVRAPTWAKKRGDKAEGDGGRGPLSGPRGRRIFVFIVGGMTPSELRTAHKLTSQLKREVVVGSTSVDNPHRFLQNMKLLSQLDTLDI
ncbi:hypothetical protein CBR_g31666 [Chara braunii]|uniref:SM/Sec1-family protein n=1 Tax=Chara braunii TaxID=69332 RepID=A0A388JXZ8_CHABU|nr:hypothetical protein CBR_g31666 [Chara braunii]|eukprot:GBG62647.1 hypothetical protein CBR_g31666 [Chara braunii]